MASTRTLHLVTSGLAFHIPLNKEVLDNTAKSSLPIAVSINTMLQKIQLKRNREDALAILPTNLRV